MSIDQQIKFRHLQCFLEVARQKSPAALVMMQAIRKTAADLAVPR